MITMVVTMTSYQTASSALTMFAAFIYNQLVIFVALLVNFPMITMMLLVTITYHTASSALTMFAALVVNFPSTSCLQVKGTWLYLR